MPSRSILAQQKLSQGGVMNRTSFIIGLLTVTLVSGSVWANAQQQCDAKKNEVGDLENKIKDQENKLKDIDNKIDAANKQIEALKKDKAAKRREIATMKTDLEGKKGEEAKACADVKKCDKFKAELAESKKEFEGIRAEVGKVAGEIKAKTAQVTVLEKKMKGYEADYAKKGCDSLVAGETEQAVIDACNKIFSDWNADKKTTDTLNGDLGKLKGKLARSRGKAHGLVRKIAALKMNLKKFCGDDAVYKEAEALEKNDVGVDAADKDIESAKERLSTIKKVRIIRPRVRKGAVKKEEVKKEEVKKDEADKKVAKDEPGKAEAAKDAPEKAEKKKDAPKTVKTTPKAPATVVKKDDAAKKDADKEKTKTPAKKEPVKKDPTKK